MTEGGRWHHVPTLYARAEGNPGQRLHYAFVEVEAGRSVDVATDTLARLLTGLNFNTSARTRRAGMEGERLPPERPRSRQLAPA